MHNSNIDQHLAKETIQFILQMRISQYPAQQQLFYTLFRPIHQEFRQYAEIDADMENHSCYILARIDGMPLLKSLTRE